MKNLKNIGLGILSFLVVFGVFKLAKLTLEAWQGVIVLLLILIYFEACLTQEDAFHREKYLKTYYGKMFLKNRLKSYLTG